MIIIDEPYISDFLLQTIVKNRFPVLKNAFAEKHLSDYNLLISNEEAVNRIVTGKEQLYTNSENAIGWISTHLKETGLPEKIELFKNKARFRELIAVMFPGFYYKKISYKALNTLDSDNLPYPFVLKPNVGFFSLGVYRIDNPSEWKKALKSLESEIHSMNDIYPSQVMDATEFIIESYIEGPEYAVDCYFDEQGTPVLMNSMEHIFASKDDVSDRLYYTSKKIIQTLKQPVLDFLQKMNEKAALRNFPLHIEIRVSDGKIIPIEGNPMRFGGWCTTADLTAYAYRYNPYVYYLQKKAPDWDMILKNMDDSYYSLVLLSNNSGLKAEEIEAFDYQKLRDDFEDPLEIRKIDFHEFPVFGFLFTRTSASNRAELEKILVSNLIDYVIPKN